MRARYMPGWVRRWEWPPVYLLIVLLGALGFPSFSGAADLHSRMAAGEIISFSENVPGSAAKLGEVKGVVNAPPEKVWRVVSDVNHFKDFMPRTLRSRVVMPEKLEMLLQKKPTQAREVETILGPTRPDPDLFRVHGQKFVEYLYGMVDLPWPLGNRWYIIKVVRDETQAAKHRYTSSWTLVMGNLRENRGVWRLEPFGELKTLVLYRLITDPGGIIPPFIVKQGTYITLPKVIAALRKRVAQIPPH